jgi:hypothetical protein
VNSRLADQLAGLRSIRQKMLEPSCWLIKVPRTPWAWKQAVTERDTLLRGLLDLYRAAALSLPDDSLRIEDRLKWRIYTDNVPAIRTELIDASSWVLLLYFQSIADYTALPKQMGIKCNELRQVLMLTYADLLVLSLPDDIEWLLVERV